jgi:hypothetical protein
MSHDRVIGRCNQAGCDAGITGVCINDLRLEECPNFQVGEAPEDDIRPVEAEESAPSQDLVVVGGGESLSVTDTDAFLRGRRARVVALIGGPEVGKTTLVAMIYEMARRRMLGRFGFAGSETIRGLEEYCFLSRMASERGQPDTPHTSRMSPLAFLHLRLADFITKNFVDVLMSDRSGEAFTGVLDQPQNCLSLPELRRSASLVLLVDGAKLAEPRAINLHISQVRRLFMVLAQHQILEPHKFVQLTLTKLDILHRANSKGDALHRFTELCEELRERAGSSVRVTLHKTAARPVRNTMPLGVGLEALVASWFEPEFPRKFVSPIGPPVIGNKSVPLDRLMARFGGG